MKTRTNLIASIFGLIASVFLSSCNSNGGNNQNSTIKHVSDSLVVSNASDTLVSPQADHDKFKLQSLVIDENYFTHKTAKAAPIDTQTHKGLNLDKVLAAQGLSEDPNSNFKIIDTLLNIKQVKILVISRESENENWAWLARVDEASKISDLVLVFYQDFVEYFSSTSAKIEGNEVTVTTQNDTDEDKSKQVKLYTLGPEPRFKSVK